MSLPVNTTVVDPLDLFTAWVRKDGKIWTYQKSKTIHQPQSPQRYQIRQSPGARAGKVKKIKTPPNSLPRTTLESIVIFLTQVSKTPTNQTGQD